VAAPVSGSRGSDQTEQDSRNSGLIQHLQAFNLETVMITVFYRSNTGIVGSNPTRGMDVCVRLFLVCAFLRVGSGFAMCRSPVEGVLTD
jgi:hypothetical protein